MIRINKTARAVAGALALALLLTAGSCSQGADYTLSNVRGKGAIKETSLSHTQKSTSAASNTTESTTQASQATKNETTAPPGTVTGPGTPPDSTATYPDTDTTTATSKQTAQAATQTTQAAKTTQTTPTTSGTKPAATTAKPATTAAQTTTTTTTTTTTSPTVPSIPSASAGRYLVGYYASWGSYSGFTPDKIDAAKLTHINYAFATVNSSLRVAIADGSNDLQNFAALRNLKAKHPALKTLISVGGWGYSKYFSDAALSVQSREVFAQSCLDFILTHGFDGVDIDWEYPVSGGLAGNINRAQDKQNFTLLLIAVREKLNAQSAKDGKQYYLTVAGGASASYIGKIELGKVLAIVDYLFIMGYDLHGSWDTYADLNAPLYRPSEPSPQYKTSVSDAIAAYISAGAPPAKLVLGMPFYGYKYGGVSAANNGLYSTFTSASAIGYSTLVSGYLNNAAYQQLWHAGARVPYLFGGSTFISYENPQSIAEKTALARAYGLAGVGAWELSHDRSAVLLASAYQTLAEKDFDPKQAHTLFQAENPLVITASRKDVKSIRVEGYAIMDYLSQALLRR